MADNDVDADQTSALVDAVKTAASKGEAVFIRGGGSKLHFFGRPCAAAELSVAEHRGIVRYSPEEMVITARTGTPIAQLVEAVTERGQCLPFEPAVFGGRATLGGTLATGLSGPARPWKGSIRDAVLGLRLINGQGEHLRFGGEVIKNVAGYDVSRLQAGALGTLGLITEVSLKLQPRPEACLHLSKSEPSAAEAISTMRYLCRKPWPFTGMSWRDDVLHLRLEGTSPALREVEGTLDGFSAGDPDFWDDHRECRFSEMGSDAGSWQLDLAPAATGNSAVQPSLITWAGARRFYHHTASATALQSIAVDHKGSLQRIGLGAPDAGNADGTPLPDAEWESTTAPALRILMTRMKEAMDPQGIFNPGRLHAWM